MDIDTGEVVTVPEEQPKATFTWRKTTWDNKPMYALMGWEGVPERDTLPPEYLDFGSAAFWATVSEIRFVDLHNIMTPPPLHVGSVLKEVDFVIFKAYITAATENLRKVRLKINESVVELVQAPDSDKEA